MRVVRFRSNWRRSFCRCKHACGSCAGPGTKLSSPFPLMWFSKKATRYSTVYLRTHDGIIARQVAEFSASARSLRGRSEEHTSELQSHSDLVCRLLLEKKKT